MVLIGRTWRALGGESFAKWSYLWRCFTDLLTRNKYLSSLHNLIPPNHYGIASFWHGRCSVCFQRCRRQVPSFKIRYFDISLSKENKQLYCLPSYTHLGNDPSRNRFLCYFFTPRKTNQLKKCQRPTYYCREPVFCLAGNARRRGKNTKPANCSQAVKHFCRRTDLCRSMLASKLPFTHHLLIQKSSFLSLTPKRLICVCHASTVAVPWVAGIKQEQPRVVQALPRLPPRQQPRSWRQGTAAQGRTNVGDVCK